jgi:uncharacterized membrane protein YGL010W
MPAVVLAPLFVFCELLFKLGLFPKLAKKLELEITAKAEAARKKKN